MTFIIKSIWFKICRILKFIIVSIIEIIFLFNQSFICLLDHVAKVNKLDAWFHEWLNRFSSLPMALGCVPQVVKPSLMESIPLSELSACRSLGIEILMVINPEALVKLFVWELLRDRNGVVYGLLPIPRAPRPQNSYMRIILLSWTVLFRGLVLLL